MLYKKYHRSYVRQFKKGTEFVCNGEKKYIVEKEPYIRLTDIYGQKTIHIDDKLYTWSLVLPTGRIFKNYISVV